MVKHYSKIPLFPSSGVTYLRAINYKKTMSDDAGAEVDSSDAGKKVELVKLEKADDTFPVKVGDTGTIVFGFTTKGEEWVQVEWDSGELESVRKGEVKYL